MGFRIGRRPSGDGGKSVKDYRELLDEGPLRFVVDQREIVLDEAQAECADTLKKKWEDHYPSLVLADSLYVTFARCSPGPEPFNAKTAWKVMKRYNKSNLGLTADLLQARLASKTLFPVPGLKSRSGCHVLYVRPSRFFPKEAPVEYFTDNLAYVMHTMMEYSDHIVILVNFDGWSMKHYATDYWHQFMSMVQGQNFPVSVQSMIMVNTPDWFQTVWNLTQPMLCKDFANKIYRIQNGNEAELDEHLAEGYQKFVPDDLRLPWSKQGGVPTDELVHDFITYRMYSEAAPTTANRRKSITRTLSWSKMLALEGKSDSTRSLKTVTSEVSIDSLAKKSSMPQAA